MFISGITYGVSFNDSYGNYGKFDDAEVRLYENENIDADWVDEMFQKARSEMDAAKRLAIYNELEAYVHDQCCYLGVMHIQNLYAWNKNLDAYAPLNNYLVYDWSWK